MSKIKDKMDEIKQLLMECELEHSEPTDYIFDGIDNNAYAYWLCNIDLDGKLEDLLENIQLYGGIK
ncbi:MAG: hypothetical protein JHC33_05060 [Ignisphaera sp.]|nr:hypothetical protein [Ignisphaera sp.]